MTNKKTAAPAAINRGSKNGQITNMPTAIPASIHTATIIDMILVKFLRSTEYPFRTTKIIKAVNALYIDKHGIYVTRYAYKMQAPREVYATCC
jgi:hypothetical protein